MSTQKRSRIRKFGAWFLTGVAALPGASAATGLVSGRSKPADLLNRPPEPGLVQELERSTENQELTPTAIGLDLRTEIKREIRDRVSPDTPVDDVTFELVAAFLASTLVRSYLEGVVSKLEEEGKKLGEETVSRLVKELKQRLGELFAKERSKQFEYLWRGPVDQEMLVLINERVGNRDPSVSDAGAYVADVRDVAVEVKDLLRRLSKSEDLPVAHIVLMAPSVFAPIVPAISDLSSTTPSSALSSLRTDFTIALARSDREAATEEEKEPAAGESSVEWNDLLV